MVGAHTGVGAELMLDTSVYVDVLAGRTPPQVDELLTLRAISHSSAAVAELAALFGRLDPGRAETAATLEALGEILDAIPAHRLSTPGLKTAGEAGVLAGVAARLGARGERLPQRATVLLHAAETGRVLLARRCDELDYLQQLAPRAQMLLYRPI
jgi:hypothetical protein